MSAEDQEAQACDLFKVRASHTNTQTWHQPPVRKAGPLPPCSCPGLSQRLSMEGMPHPIGTGLSQAFPAGKKEPPARAGDLGVVPGVLGTSQCIRSNRRFRGQKKRF